MESDRGICPALLLTNSINLYKVRVVPVLQFLICRMGGVKLSNLEDCFRTGLRNCLQIPWSCDLHVILEKCELIIIIMLFLLNLGWEGCPVE